MLTVIVNGTPATVAADSSVRDLVTALELPDQGIAVALDGEVVPRGQWNTLLRNDSEIEIVTAVQGG